MRFSEVLGQEGTIQLLKSRLKNGTALDTSYIFSGGSGQGKTTLARILARGALCLDFNKEEAEPCNACDNCTMILNGTPGAFEEKDAASGGTIDIVRAMVDDIPFSVLNASKRIWLFDEAHRMSPGAQDVLLKPLEEKNVVGIFCTTESSKIRGAIKGRCEEHTIRKVAREEVLVRMKGVLEKEGVAHEDDAVLTVIDYSGGHVRDILNRLEMIAQIGSGISLQSVREYLHLGVVASYYHILLALGDSKQLLELIDKVSEQVPPEDVMAGLAEAAMNSFRLANGMYTDFVYVDRALGQAVYDRFGKHALKLAEYFLRTKYPTRTGVICDLLTLSQNGGTPTASAVETSAPPVVFAQAPAPAVVSSAPAAPAALPAQLSPPVQQQSALAPGAPVDPKRRPDGIGPRGSDPLGLTDIDHRGVPQSRPRGTTVQVALSFHGGTAAGSGDDSKPITHDEWKMEFNRTWGR
jgi:DNA polymerase III subunit gamma/tau